MLISTRPINLCVGVISLFASILAFGSEIEDPAQIYDMKLEDLLDVPITVVTRKQVPIRETSAAITVITKEELLNSGARELSDALTLFVPGVTFANDVEGVVGIMFRGMWGIEGKVLLMIDGLEMNERVFGALMFGNHYQMDNIERIEIIRGPGSAIYSGFAEIAVINIITKGSDINSGYAVLSNSQMSQTFSHRGLSFGFGKTGESFSSSLTGALSYGNRSQNTITDFYGNQSSMLNNSQLNLIDLNLNLKYKNVSFRQLINLYRTTQIDLWGANHFQGPIQENFDTYVSELKYEAEILSNLKVTPRIIYKKDQPWIASVPDQNYVNNKWAEKYELGVTSVWDVSEKTSLESGFEYYRSDIHKPNGPNEEVFLNDSNRTQFGFNNYGIFSQFRTVTPYFTVTLGARYDTSDQFGGAFLPRIGLTKTLDRLHGKAFYAQSFRTPGGILSNRTAAGTRLIPEVSTDYEAEIGYQLTQSISCIVNGFDVSIDRPIVYQSNPVTGVGSYSNFGRLGTRGVETQIRIMEKNVSFLANHAFYQVKTNDVSNYSVPTDSGVLLGSTAHRINAIFGYHFTPKISIHPSLSFFGSRYAFTSAGALSLLGAFTIYNVNLRIKDAFLPGVEIDVGVHDIFDRVYDYAPGYNSEKGVLPGLSRSFVLKLAYTHPF